LIYVEINQGRN